MKVNATYRMQLRAVNSIFRAIDRYPRISQAMIIVVSLLSAFYVFMTA